MSRVLGMAGIICLRKEHLAVHPQGREERESVWVQLTNEMLGGIFMYLTFDYFS